MILAIFDLQVVLILPTKYPVICLSNQEIKGKLYFQDGGHGGYLGFPIGLTLTIFDLHVTPILLSTKFPMN